MALGANSCFLGLMGGSQHLGVGQEWQGARHRLVDDLAIGENDGLIRPLGDRRVVGDDQDGLPLGGQAFRTG